MAIKKLKTSSSTPTIRKPTPERAIKDCVFSKEVCDSLEVDEAFENMKTIQLSDVVVLIDRFVNTHHGTLDAQTAFANIRESLTTIGSKRERLSNYTAKCIAYLNQGHIQSLFSKKFQSKLLAFKKEQIKQNNKLQGDINAALITSNSGEEYYNELIHSEQRYNCLHSLLASIFSCDKYFLQEWANKSLQSTQVYQPDWCASVKFWKHTYDLIIAEAKPKGRQHRGIISDKVELGRELKSMLEELIKSGTEDPEVFGLLVKGEVLEMYAMDLKDDGVYRMVLIESVNLITNFSEIIHLNRTLPLLYRVKERALAVAKRLEIVELDKSRGAAVNPTLPTAWFRQSMDPKMKTLFSI